MTTSLPSNSGIIQTAQKMEVPPNVIIRIFDENGVIDVKHTAELNIGNVRGDVCLLTKGSTIKNLEKRMTIKTVIIIVPFLILQAFFIVSIVLREIINSRSADFTFYTKQIYFYFSLLFRVFSASSCFTNSLSFILVTPVYKKKYDDLFRSFF